METLDYLMFAQYKLKYFIYEVSWVTFASIEPFLMNWMLLHLSDRSFILISWASDSFSQQLYLSCSSKIQDSSNREEKMVPYF